MDPLIVNGSPRLICSECRQLLPLSSFVDQQSDCPICRSCSGVFLVASLPHKPPTPSKARSLVKQTHTPAKSVVETYHRDLPFVATFKNLVTKQFGMRCLFTNSSDIQIHHILPFHSKGLYDAYRIDPLNGIPICTLIHSWVTSMGALHYVKSFFDLLDSRFYTSHSNYPIPQIYQRSIFEDLYSVQFKSFASKYLSSII